jgi:CubicO group peptidase (beta-lactamase class C family)
MFYLEAQNLHLQLRMFENRCDLFIATVPCTGVFSQRKEENLTLNTDSLFSKVINKNLTGAAILIMKVGKTQFSRGYEFAYLEYDIPTTDVTVFDVASLEKQFTGIAVSLLVTKGKLWLDDILKYITELRGYGYAITVDHLLHHPNGIRDPVATLALQ